MAWTQEQLTYGRLIIAVGQEMKMSSRDITIALMTAMRESTLRNLTWGDRDSLGLFQQRPSQGWGTPQQVTDPIYATRTFYTRLKRLKNRNNMSLTQAAQAVQRSAYPGAYAQWEDEATRMMMANGQKLATLPGRLTTPVMSLDDFDGLNDQVQFPTASSPESSPETPGLESALPPGMGDALDPVMPTGVRSPFETDPELQTLMPGTNVDFPAVTQMVSGGARQAGLQAAYGLLGTHYSYGGGHAGKSGPSQGRTGYGVDCSGLVRVYLEAAGYKVGPMTAAQQMRLGAQVPIGQLEPGDLVAARDGGHIAIYIGNGKMLEAQKTGTDVMVSPVRGNMVGIKLSLAGRGGGTVKGTSGSSLASMDVSPTGIPVNVEANPQQQTVPAMSYPGLR